MEAAAASVAEAVIAAWVATGEAGLVADMVIWPVAVEAAVAQEVVVSKARLEDSQ